ncbi:hypothetical protein Tco_0404639 [Tanacetum coccineum]
MYYINDSENKPTRFYIAPWCIEVMHLVLVVACEVRLVEAQRLKKKSGKKTVVEKNIESVVAPIRAKKNKIGKKVVVEKNQVSVNEPTAAKKKNTGKKADVEMHRVSVAEPTSEKSKTSIQGML